MPTAARSVRNSYDEYLRLEDLANVRHEYLDGVIYALPRGTPDHARLASRVVRMLGARLRAGCEPFTSDLRVRIPASGLTTYPDVTVVCGTTRRADDDRLAVINPVVLVEVTSPSTDEYDRSEKLRHYQLLESVREVVLVAHERPSVTVVRRSAEGWSSHESGPGHKARLESVSAELDVDELYRDLEDALAR